MLNQKKPSYESYLDLKLTEQNDLGKFEKTSFDNKYLISNPKIKLLNRTIKNLLITTDQNLIITEISFFLPEIINNDFYGKMMKKYELPTKILVADEIFEDDEEINDEQNIKEVFYTLKNGDFNEKVFYIYWNKNKFQIKISFNYNNNTTEFIFRNQIIEDF